jgi:hypothetical protein
MSNEKWDRPDQVSTLFIFTFLMIGLVVSPFITCAELLGYKRVPIPPVMQQNECGTRTVEQCEYEKEMRKIHPTWYD